MIESHINLLLAVRYMTSDPHSFIYRADDFYGYSARISNIIKVTRRKKKTNYFLNK